MEAGHEADQCQHDAQVGHIYPAVHASGNTQLHLGDKHYHAATPAETLLDKVAKSLFFPELSVRQDNIEEHYSETFDWVLKPSSSEQPSWDSFIDWFNGDGCVYWISGKPGSGKSTLMKYLVDHVQQTRQRDGAPRVVLSFWFWEASHNELQRNLQGCLRSLIWQVLQTDGIGDVVAQSIKDHANFVWTTKRLHDALREALRILQHRNRSTCIFLDGLDESGRDARPLITFVRDLAKQFPSVKLCISSRPEQIFSLAFSCYPKLRMQDLNRSDIDIIVRKTFLEVEEVAHLWGDESSAIEELADHIGYRAQGVLLWVRLVINDLLRGIGNFDTVSELRHRLEKMPEELYGLYDFMLRRNSDDLRDYRADAIFYCQLISHRPMSMIEFYLAITDDVRSSYLRLDDGVEMLHAVINCERLATRISVRTGGLLEVKRGYRYKRYPRTRSSSLTAFRDAWGDTTVQFIHRTARSYFMDTAGGFGLSSDMSMSSESIKKICFEVTLAAQAVLDSLESPALLGAQAVASVIYNCIICSREQRSSNRKSFKSLFNSLLRKRLLSIDPNYIPNVIDLNANGVSARPLLSTSHGEISYCHLYAFHGLWDDAEAEYQTTNGCKDLKYLSLLVAYLLSGVTFQAMMHKNGFDRAIALYDLAVDHGASPNCQITNSYGEVISIFHEIIPRLKQLEDRGLLFWMVKIKDWLLRADNATGEQTYGPTMDRCTSIFLQVNKESLYLLGDFSLVDINLIHSVTLDQGLKTRAIENGTTSQRCIMWDCSYDSWKPQVYALAHADLLLVKQALSSSTFEKYKEPTWICNGVILCPGWDLGHENLQAAVDYVKAHSTRLRSLSEALLYLGKSTEAIQEFGAAEEARLSLQIEEIAFRQWKSWYYGIEDDSLQRYRSRPIFPGIDTPELAPSTPEVIADDPINSDSDQAALSLDDYDPGEDDGSGEDRKVLHHSPVQRNSNTSQTSPCECAWCLTPDDVD